MKLKWLKWPKWPKRRHKHDFKEIPWNTERLGPDVEFLDEYYAKYKYLMRCSCGEEKIVTETGLI